MVDTLVITEEEVKKIEENLELILKQMDVKPITAVLVLSEILSFVVEFTMKNKLFDEVLKEVETSSYEFKNMFGFASQISCDTHTLKEKFKEEVQK